MKAFCYTSSVAVYGSGRTRVATEDAPVLTVEGDIRSECWAVEQTRIYGLMKLEGEHALRSVAARVRDVVLRPTVVVSVPQIIGIRDRSRIERTLAAHRHTHHVHVGDVSDAIIWSLERAAGGGGPPGSVATHDLSEDEFSEPTHAALMHKARAATGDRRFRFVRVPWVADWLRDFPAVPHPSIQASRLEHAVSERQAPVRRLPSALRDGPGARSGPEISGNRRRGLR